MKPSRRSRDAILEAVRRAQTAEPIADPQTEWTSYADPPAKFAETLESVGGRFVRVNSAADVSSALENRSPFSDAKVMCSVIPEVQGNCDLDRIDDPHGLENVDFAIIPGTIGVAENAAVWVPTDQMHHRVICFLSQHLAIVIPTRSIVSNMHEAYARLDEQNAFANAGFGCFISGPSKTADIEQSLVIGAHGARSLTVIGIDG